MQREQRGFAFPLSLLALLLLSVLSLALLSMSAVEPLITRNLADAEQARFVAEAGIEWAFATLREAPDWDRVLVGADATRGAILIADAPIPGHPASSGTFTVRVRNDSLPGDSLVTGAPADGGGPTRDTNSQLLLASAGQAASARRTLQVVLGRIALPTVPAALAFPGRSAAISASGDFEIDGNDRNPDGSPGSCAPVLGIAVSGVLPEAAPGANEAGVEAALAGALANVKGKPQDPAAPGAGANTIAPEFSLSQARIQSFVAAARNADVVLAGAGSGGLSVSDIGGSCASSGSSSACWGTPNRPKVVYFQGDPDPAAPVSTLRISGNSAGHGILIVEDGEIWISGNFLWHGLILVTGRRVALGFLGGGEQVVSGAAIVNETSDSAPGKGVLTGNARLRYSCQVLRRAQQAPRLVTLKSWREVVQ